MTGRLQEKNGRFYMVVSALDDGKHQPKGKSNGPTDKGHKQRAKDMLKGYLQGLEELAEQQRTDDIAPPE